MIDGTFVSELCSRMAQPEVHRVAGREYLVHARADGLVELLDTPRPETLPDPLKLGSLAGMVEYIKTNVDELVRDTLLLVVDSPTQVRLVSKIVGEFAQRAEYARCNTSREPFAFDRLLDHETFIIHAQARFIETEELNSLLRVIGCIKEGAVRETADDGVTQSVTAKAGITLVGKVSAPRYVTLRPYRTFIEVEQPESRFLLRLKSGDEKPMVALFEADGGAWRALASQRIAEYLKQTGVAVIL